APESASIASEPGVEGRRRADLGLIPGRFAAEARRSAFSPGGDPSPQRASSPAFHKVPRKRFCPPNTRKKFRESASVGLFPRARPTKALSSLFAAVADRQKHFRRSPPGFESDKSTFVA